MGGIDDEADALYVAEQMESVMKRYPRRMSGDGNDNGDVPGADLKAFLSRIGMVGYFGAFSKNGFEDLHTIRVLVRHKGMDYVERNVLSKKLNINVMAHRIQIVEALKALMAEENEEKEQSDDATQSNGGGPTVENVDAPPNHENVLEL